MTTSIDDLDDLENLDEYINQPDSIDIFDMSIPENIRINTINSLPDHLTLECINRLISMYYSSTNTLLKQFIIELCKQSTISSTLKIECCKCLCIKNNDDTNHYQLLHNLLLNYSDIPLPCKILAIIFLSKCDDMKDNTLKHFYSIIDDKHIECEFKYKMIHSIDKVHNLDNNIFIYPLLIYFSECENMFTTYRILSCQNLLQNFKENLQENKKFLKIQQILYIFSCDVHLDYNLRADSADVLLGLGDDEHIKLARDVIILLGRQTHTIFNNQQNVHNVHIDESTEPIIQKIFSKQLNNNISFENIKNEIIDPIQSQIKHLNNQLDQLNIAFNRIELDNSLYGSINTSLKSILIRIKNYTINHKHETQLINRLQEELIESSGKCSTGYGTRLLNVLSGYDDLSIKISDEDSIKGKVSGRLNKLIKEIEDEDKRSDVMFEMTLTADSEILNRGNFLEFFRDNIGNIKSDIWEEVNEYLEYDVYELYFRNAISSYEGL